MGKTKRQKTADWKHLMAGRVFSKPYMLHHNTRYNKKPRARFNLSHLKKTINLLFKFTGFPFAEKGSRQYTLTKDVEFDYKNMKFKIRGCADGIKHNRNHEPTAN